MGLLNFFARDKQEEIERLQQYISDCQRNMNQSKDRIKLEREHMKGCCASSKQAKMERIRQERERIAEYQKRIRETKKELSYLKKR